MEMGENLLSKCWSCMNVATTLGRITPCPERLKVAPHQSSLSSQLNEPKNLSDISQRQLPWSYCAWNGCCINLWCVWCSVLHEILRCSNPVLDSSLHCRRCECQDLCWLRKCPYIYPSCPARRSPIIAPTDPNICPDQPSLNGYTATAMNG